MTRADRAEALFYEGYNCCQSVFGAFCDIAGMDLAAATKMVSALGGGVSKLREICGAVSAMALIVGIMDGYNEPEDRDGKIRTYHEMQDLAALFKEKHDTVVCREILNLKPGEDPAEPSIRTPEYYASRPCPGCIRTAAQILADHFGLELPANEGCGIDTTCGTNAASEE